MEKGSPGSYNFEDDGPKGLNLACLIPVIIVTCLLVFVFAAPVFIPNIFWPETRPSVSTANAEMRNMAVSMESYYIDYGQYPFPASGASWAVVSGATTEALVGYTPHSLTTPVVHISSLPDDPFNSSATQNPNIPSSYCYRYATTPATCWILCSNGPDQDIDMPLKRYVDLNDCGCDITKFLSQYGGPAIEYDPTNGSNSNGDIIRTGP